MSAPSVQPESSRSHELADALLVEIVDGVWARGARLPTERELAARFAASRVSIHQALHRLASWQVIEIRPRSGAVVRPSREWKIDVLPAYLRRATTRPDAEGVATALATALGDLLSSRRAIVFDLVEQASGRLEAGDLDPAREAVARAWEVRDDRLAFVRTDLEMARCWLEAAGMLPSVWLLNTVAGVYLGALEPFAELVVVPDDYVPTHEALFAAMEAGDGPRALAIARDYFDRMDGTILGRPDPS